MKKIFALLLCLACLASTMALASCDALGGFDPDELAGKSPEELYADTQEALKDYTRYKIESEQVITMTIQGTEYVIPQSVTSIVDGQNSYFRSYAKNIDNSVIENEGWYADGILYNGNTKVYAELPWDTYVTKYLNGEPTDSMLLNIPEEWFEDVHFEQKDGSKNRFMVFKISGEKYEEMFDTLGGLAAQANISDVVYTVEFTKKGELVGVVTEFEMTIQGFEATCVSTGTIFTEDIDPITPPADKDDYRKGYLG